jgi:membrane protein YqaA with SNARE-associated domain
MPPKPAAAIKCSWPERIAAMPGRDLKVTRCDLLIAVWALAEATVWFVVPDFLLLALGVARPRHPVRSAVICLLFSLLGISLMWWLCQRFPMQSIVYSLPWTYPNMGEHVARLSAQSGVWVALEQPASTIPVKVWVVVAASSTDWQFLPFLLCVGLARGVRMLIFSWVGCKLGQRYPKLATPTSALLYSLAFLAVLDRLAARFL